MAAASSTRSEIKVRARRRRHYGVGHADAVLHPAVRIAVIIAFLVLVLLPVLYMVLLSLTPDQAVALGAVSLSHLDLKNYVDMWSSAPIATGIVHSLIIAGSSAILSVIVGLLAAYPLARIKFRGRTAFLQSLIWAQTVPHTTLVLPLFAVLAYIQTLLSVHLIGGYGPIIALYMTFGLPLSTWLLFSYMRRVPLEIEEAALIDGCSRVRMLWRVIFPVALPAAAVAFVFAFLVGWNDVLFASVLTTEQNTTLAVTLQRLADVETGLPAYGQLMAASVVSAIPAVVLYVGLQRYLVQGLSSGSVAGALSGGP